MVTGTYEFEVVPDSEGGYVAIPYDLPGATQGEDFDDLCDMTADFLKKLVEYHDVHGLELPRPTYGNEPKNGGKTMLVSVTAGRETVAKLSAAQAAHELGVTPGRITQLIAANQLEGWREGRNTYVTVDSVLARKAGGARVLSPGCPEPATCPEPNLTKA